MCDSDWRCAFQITCQIQAAGDTAPVRQRRGKRDVAVCGCRCLVAGLLMAPAASLCTCLICVFTCLILVMCRVAASFVLSLPSCGLVSLAPHCFLRLSSAFVADGCLCWLLGVAGPVLSSPCNTASLRQWITSVKPLMQTHRRLQ